MIHSNINTAIAELFKIGGRLEAAAKEIASDATRIVNKNVVSQLHKMNLVASGDLLKSVTVQSIRPVSAGFHGGIYIDSPYADVIEEGRHPNRKAPPVDRILKWMIIRGLDPTLQGAWNISRKIASEGIPAKHPFAKAEEASIQSIRLSAEVEISEALSKFENVRFNEGKEQFIVELPN